MLRVWAGRWSIERKGDLGKGGMILHIQVQVKSRSQVHSFTEFVGLSPTEEKFLTSGFSALSQLAEPPV